MSLPRVPFPTRKIELAGGTFEVRGLSVHEVRAIQNIDDADRSDAEALALAADVTADEAAEWFRSVPAAVAAEVITTILELSGITKEFPKSETADVHDR